MDARFSSVIRKSGCRFSEKIMLNQKPKAMMIRPNLIAL